MLTQSKRNLLLRKSLLLHESRLLCEKPIEQNFSHPAWTKVRRAGHRPRVSGSSGFALEEMADIRGLFWRNVIDI